MAVFRCVVVEARSSPWPAGSAGWIAWSWQPASVVRRACLSGLNHRCGEHSLEPADPIPQIGKLLAHPRHIQRGVAHPLVEKNDLAQRPYRVAVQAHAAAASRRRRPAGPRLDGRVNISATLRCDSSAILSVSG